MRLVLAEELVAGHLGDPGHGRGVAVVVDQALGLRQVRELGQALRVGGVDQPLHVAAAVERVGRHQKPWLLCKMGELIFTHSIFYSPGNRVLLSLALRML